MLKRSDGSCSQADAAQAASKAFHSRASVPKFGVTAEYAAAPAQTRRERTRRVRRALAETSVASLVALAAFDWMSGMGGQAPLRC